MPGLVCMSVCVLQDARGTQRNYIRINQRWITPRDLPGVVNEPSSPSRRYCGYHWRMTSARLGPFLCAVKFKKKASNAHFDMCSSSQTGWRGVNRPRPRREVVSNLRLFDFRLFFHENLTPMSLSGKCRRWRGMNDEWRWLYKKRPFALTFLRLILFYNAFFLGTHHRLLAKWARLLLHSAVWSRRGYRPSKMDTTVLNFGLLILAFVFCLLLGFIHKSTNYKLENVAGRTYNQKW